MEERALAFCMGIMYNTDRILSNKRKDNVKIHKSDVFHRFVSRRSCAIRYNVPKREEIIMKRAFAILLCAVMLLAVIPFSAFAEEPVRNDAGSIRNFGGIILCDAVKDEAYDKFGLKVKLFDNGRAGGTVYWLFSEDYSILNVLVEARDACFDDQKYYDEDGKEIRIYSDYYQGCRSDYDESLYEYDPVTKRIISEEMPYPTALLASRNDIQNGLYWHTDGVEVWVNPTNNLQNDGGEAAESGYHYKIDIGGYKVCKLFTSKLFGDDCDGIFDAEINITKRNPDGSGEYIAEFAIPTHYFGDKEIPKKNDDGTWGTSKRSKSNVRKYMEEGITIGITAMMVDQEWLNMPAWFNGRSQPAEYRWNLTSHYMEGTLPGESNKLKNHPYAAVIGTSAFNDCEKLGKEHEWIDRSTAPTCTEAGVEKTVCRLCGKTNEKPLDPDPSLHVVDLTNPKEVTKEPSCTEPGTGICTCSACTQDVEVELPALGHNFAGQFYSDETGHWQKCERCGADGEPAAHNLGEVDCEHESVCTDCAFVVPAGHDLIFYPPTAATFEAEGCNPYLFCTRCHATFKYREDPEDELIPTTPEEEKTPMLVWENPFTDVKKSSWFHDAARFVNYYGMINGITPTTFEPNTPMTRGMLVTVLYRYEGEPVPEGQNPFSDVKDKEYYAKPITWAAEKGIVSGVGGDKFDPKGNLTREQIAKIMFGYAEMKGSLPFEGADLSVYPDCKKVSSWATEYMAWANAAGLITGTNIGGVSYLDPQGNATRAQVATIIQRLIENVLTPVVY